MIFEIIINLNLNFWQIILKYLWILDNILLCNNPNSCFIYYIINWVYISIIYLIIWIICIKIWEFINIKFKIKKLNILSNIYILIFLWLFWFLFPIYSFLFWLFWWKLNRTNLPKLIIWFILINIILIIWLINFIWT